MGATLKLDRSLRQVTVQDLSGRVSVQVTTQSPLREAVSIPAAKVPRELLSGRVLPRVQFPVLEVAGFGPAPDNLGDQYVVSLHPERTSLASILAFMRDSRRATPWTTLVIDRPVTVGVWTPDLWNDFGDRDYLLVVQPAGRIVLDADFKLFWPVIAGPSTVFEAAEGMFRGRIERLGNRQRSAATQRVLPQWWGASPEAAPAINRRAIQAAIDWLPSSGGELFLPDGAYPVDGAITLRNSVTLAGESRDGTVLQLQPGGTADGIPTALRTVNIPLTSADGPPTGAGRCRVGNLSVVDAGLQGNSYGLRFGWKNNVECRDVMFRGFHTAIQCWDPIVGEELYRYWETDPDNWAQYRIPLQNTVLERVTIEGQGRSVGFGVDVAAGANWLCMRGLRISGVDTGVAFSDPRVVQPRSCVNITDSTFTGVRTGIRVDRGSVPTNPRTVAALRIQDGRFEDCVYAAVDLERDSLGENGVLISDCGILSHVVDDESRSDANPRIRTGPTGVESWHVHVVRAGGLFEQGRGRIVPEDEDSIWEPGDILFNRSPTGTGLGGVAGWVYSAAGLKES